LAKYLAIKVLGKVLRYAGSSARRVEQRRYSQQSASIHLIGIYPSKPPANDRRSAQRLMLIESADHAAA
jgi:hypothetical protein